MATFVYHLHGLAGFAVVTTHHLVSTDSCGPWPSIHNDTICCIQDATDGVMCTCRCLRALTALCVLCTKSSKGMHELLSRCSCRVVWSAYGNGTVVATCIIHCKGALRLLVLLSGGMCCIGVHVMNVCPRIDTSACVECKAVIVHTLPTVPRCIIVCAYAWYSLQGI